MRAALLIGLAASGCAAGADRTPSYGDEFWRHWGDGRAELAGYELTFPRYGEPRRGVAVAIFVTETFTDRFKVKADPGNHPESDTQPVIKLNLIRDFQTGIYDYNLMTSVFVGLTEHAGRPGGSPTKVSFTSQEWCGHVYHQLLFDAKGIRQTSHSYFDGEADLQDVLPAPPGGFAEDTLLLWARGLAAPMLAPGEKLQLPFLPSTTEARLLHRTLAWDRATLSRGAQPEKFTVPAGTFMAETYEVRIEGGRSLTVHVEADAPRRVLAWETSDGERALLLSSARRKYWAEHGEGRESALEELGLSRRAPRTP